MNVAAFAPTDEQIAAINSFSDGRTLMLNACAGSGKTATLEAMANASKQRGLYIVFSKAAAADASKKFPSQVAVKTSHALAFSQIKNMGFSLEKMLGSLNAKAIVKVMGLKALSFDGFVLLDFEIGHAVRQTISAFCHSDNNAISRRHVPETELLRITLTAEALSKYQDYIAKEANALWLLMSDIHEDGYPLGHDGYFKLWSLSLPQLPFMYVLLDEAQDSNPALLHVLKNQDKCQLVFVGDRYQQIYAWRGAVNAMEKLKAEQFALTRSFRYGQHIADFATALLKLLGNENQLTGRDDIIGGFACEKPNAYISRTNAALIGTLVEHKDQIDSIYIVGEGREILSLLNDVKRLQNKQKAAMGEFFGFKDWNDVLQYCEKVHKSPLDTIVQLVEKFGEGAIRDLVSSTCQNSQEAAITLSTAHKAKGLEFDEVCLSDDFAAPLEESEFIQAHSEAEIKEAVVVPHPEKKLLILKSELQVLYVAATRARRNVSLPIWCYELFNDILGDAPTDSTTTKPKITMQGSRNTISGAPVSQYELYAVLDFETTGLNPVRGDRAIELGISLCANGKEIDTFSSLINPGMPIDPFITDLTGISNDMVASAPTAKSVMQNALDFIGDAQLVAHNAGFDKKFWRHEIQQELTIGDDREFLCTLMLSRRIFQSFASHKLGEIAQELYINPVQSHRALADAQVTSQVLSIMFERLRAAHPDEIIDAQFLKRYQRRSKASLPDLTTEQLARSSIQQVAKPKPIKKSAKKKTVSKAPVSDNALRAEQMNADAKSTMQELDQLLERTLTIDDRLDWASLVEIEQFKSSIPRRPFITYDENDTPVDIEYLTIPDPKPIEPEVPPKPLANEYTPQVGFMDKVMFRENRLVQEAHEAYKADLNHWQNSAEQNNRKHAKALQLWSDTAESIDKKNDHRYRQCIDDQKVWHAEKLEHEKKSQIVMERVAAFKNAYECKDPVAVEKYCTEVLSRSIYPDYFPDDIAVNYQPESKSLRVMIKLIHPDDLPTVASVSFVKSRDEIKPKDLSATAKNTLYANVARSIAVRTLHELIESDTADAIEHVIVNGYVDTVDLATGHDHDSVILSVYSTKTHFLGLRLDRVDATSCFEGLGGRGTTRGIAKLTSVDAIELNDLVES